ncbi:MAG: dephospho-CoA kinase [Bacteroidales bacterium]|nr:dephospho-CoA kinase [Bacteroidales bacterium]
MIKVGVTGGIGSGKTTACKVFECLGVPVYYADEAARLLVDSDQDIRNSLIALFGNDIYEGNTLNRTLFASLVFNNRQLLEAANQIIHPSVRADFNSWVRMHESKDYVIEEAAILFESGSNALIDKCITIVSPVEIRIKRIIKRPGMTSERIKSIMANQWTDEKKVKLSDFVVINDEKSLIIPQILFIHRQLTVINKTLPKTS